MPEKLKPFVVNIFIIEGRHYIWPNMNSAVLVKIDNQKKCTAVKPNTDCPYYNEFFVFEFQSTFEQLIDKNVTITVIKPGSILRKRKVLGYTTFDIGTIWYQKDHQLYHKWAILTAPSKEYVGGTRGYLKLDVSVLCKGELPKIPKTTNTDEIEGNLFLPEGVTTERQRVLFIFDIHRGLDFVKKNPIQESKRVENAPTTSIEISFSGVTVKTTTKKASNSPVWNERLILPELFPPLCQRFKIELNHDGAKRATRFLNLGNISNDKEEGFLPTFGPTFLHFYSPNNLEGYLGKVLLSLQTSLLGDMAEYEAKLNLQPTQTQSLKENVFFKYEEVLLFAIIFDVSLISKKFGDKAISFRMSCGPLQMEESGDKAATSVTPLVKPKTTNNNYCYLPIQERKPCVYLYLSLPDVRKRIFNYNLLYKMLKDLKSRLEKIERIFNDKDYKTASVEAESLLFETLDFISSACGKYIDIASSYNFSSSSLLDQERLKISLKEIEMIKSMVENISSDQNKRKIFQKIEKIYSKIEVLVDDIEDWPLIYFWMVYGTKRVAYSIVKPRDVIYSPVDEEKGIYCGILRSFYFHTEGNSGVVEYLNIACKVDALIWMGLPRHLQSCLPHGFIFSDEPIPRTLVAKEKHLFQARIHIFQGRFAPGSDKSGLSDPFAHVIMGAHFQETQVWKKTLNPIWDQTLLFQNIELYGSNDFIVANPPSVTIEIYDKDECHRTEALGKTVVKPVVKTLKEPHGSPIKLTWYQIYNIFDVSAEVLAAVELLETKSKTEKSKGEDVVAKIPPNVRPNLVNHRIEVVFWGVRDLKKLQLLQINKPKVVVNCGDATLISDTLSSAKKHLNFSNPIKLFEANFPEQEEYAPPLSVKMFDCRNFGISVFAGTHVLSMKSFFYKPMAAEERNLKLMVVQNNSLDFTPTLESIIQTLDQSTTSKITVQKEAPKKKTLCQKFLQCLSCKRQKKVEKPPPVVIEEIETEDSDDFDWWTKFYASLEETPKTGKIPLSHKYKLKVYPNELEKQPEFDGFADTLLSFAMYKGKRTGDETVDEENTTGVFKGALKIYQWASNFQDYVTPNGLPLQNGYFQDFPSNSPVKFVLRVYCVRGLNLRPKDINGKSDPYLCLTLNQNVISDKENCVKGQVNPVFGRCFEFNGIFPQDHTLAISVMDWDAATSDDLIGETKIDLENRFYSKHRGHCGLAADYLTSGYCQWRDQQKPTTILEHLCRKHNIPNLEYTEKSVVVASKEFTLDNSNFTDDVDINRQVLALIALEHWSEIPLVGCALVPEHVETRSLFHPHRSGIEQGKLQLWIDILPSSDLPTPKPVNITPRKPVAYELRVIVWNAEKIILEEKDILTGEKKADVFIKGWVTEPETAQYTDVHYRVLSGEANFNWRFIFSFDYLATENKIIQKKKSRFGFEESEVKQPCKLIIQAWENDTFTSHDFLGVLNLELSRLYRGSSLAKNCSLALTKPNAQILNLFKVKRSRGWWPLKTIDPKNQKEMFAGTVELEFELLTKEEADENPAGIGRRDPQGLPKPNRPDTSFSWLTNPCRGIKYAIKIYKWKLIKYLIFLIMILVILYALYTVPELGLKRLFALPIYKN